MFRRKETKKKQNIDIFQYLKKFTGIYLWLVVIRNLLLLVKCEKISEKVLEHNEK